MQKPIKIAFDASPLLVNKTGVAYYIERLVTELARKYPDDIELVGFYYNFLGRKSTSHMPQAANIHYRPVRLIPSKVVYQLRRWNVEVPVEIFIKERVDFILFGNFLGYPSLRSTPSAPVVHDLTYLDLPDYVAPKNRSDLERFVPRQIERSSFVITVSEFSKDKISRTYELPQEKILVTPIPALPPDKYSPEECDEKLSELGIKKPFILFLGTVEPRKNIVSLIDAYEALPQKLKASYSLVIAGRIGWNCEQEIARLKQAKQDGLDVIHVGYVDEVAKSVLYQKAELFSSASHYEGFGMPVLEAMSYQTACAVSNIQVFHEVAGKAGRYFDQSNPRDISRVLQDLLSDTAKRQLLAKQGKDRADSFNWETIAESLLARVHLTLEGKATKN
jgi:glycosyltransferase involved in cell wall biosynthesis